MIHSIPGVGEITINTIILDLNGTLSVGGKIVAGVHDRIKRLQSQGYKIILFTGNTRNDADDIARELGIEWRQAQSAEEKKLLSIELDAESCASIGNGRIDAAMMEVVQLGIATLQSEGVHVDTLRHVDLVVPTINDALDLFIDPARLVATLRK